MIKKLRDVYIVLLFILSPLLAVMMPGIAHASGNTWYWCGGNSGDFNTATHWYTTANCAGTDGVPVSGDSIIFDNSVTGTPVTADATITEDMTSAIQLNTITFEGSNPYAFTINQTGSFGISLTGGITDTNQGAQSDSFNVNIALGANATVTDTAGSFGVVIGNYATPNTLTLGTYSLTLDSDTVNGGSITIGSELEGSGALIMNGTADGVYNFQTAAQGFYTGPVTIDNGQADIYNTTAFGTGLVTIDSGASLSTYFASSTPTFANPLNIAGDGFDGSSGALIVNDGCPAVGSNGSCTDTGTDTLDGTITLAGVTTVGNAGDTVDLTGTVTCSTYTIGLADGSTGTLNGVPSGCSPATTGGSTTGSSSSSNAAPKTPDTGLAAFKSNPIIVLIITLASVAVIAYANKKLKVAKK